MQHAWSHVLCNRLSSFLPCATENIYWPPSHRAPKLQPTLWLRFALSDPFCIASSRLPPPLIVNVSIPSSFLPSCAPCGSTLVTGWVPAGHAWLLCPFHFIKVTRNRRDPQGKLSLNSLLGLTQHPLFSGLGPESLAQWNEEQFYSLVVVGDQTIYSSYAHPLMGI